MPNSREREGGGGALVPVTTEPVVKRLADVATQRERDGARSREDKKGEMGHGSNSVHMTT